MIPDSATPPTVAAAAVAVLRGARTVREVAAAIGRSSAATHSALRRARYLGLVDFDDGQRGTLRSTLGVAAADPPKR